MPPPKKVGALCQATRDTAPVDQLLAVAKEGVESVRREFEHVEAIENMLRSVWLVSGSATEDKVAREAARSKMAELPVGATIEDLRAARDAAIAPFEEQIRARQARERDNAVRESLVTAATWRLPWDYPADEKPKAVAAARAALERVRRGAPQDKMRKASCGAVEAILAAHERRKVTVSLIEGGLKEISIYVGHLERAGWQFNPKASALVAELEPTIRQRLEREIGGKESPDEVAKRVRHMVKRVLGIDSRAA